ncbi:retrovirus-related pol polyprotein from transposon TNT 1-94 [Tanacetum coccineum]
MLKKMLNWKLEAEAESTMAFELLKFIKSQFRGGLLGIMDFCNLVLLIQLDTAGDVPLDLSKDTKPYIKLRSSRSVHWDQHKLCLATVVDNSTLWHRRLGHANQAHTSHKAKNMVSTKSCLELLHMDLFGPSAIKSYGGSSIIAIRTDHGREFDNEVQFGAYCDALCITHNFSTLRTPQSNGVVERKNRTLQEMSRTMLNEQSIP